MFGNRNNNSGCGCAGCVGNLIALIVLAIAALILFNDSARRQTHPERSRGNVTTVKEP